MRGTNNIFHQNSAVPGLFWGFCVCVGTLPISYESHDRDDVFVWMSGRQCVARVSGACLFGERKRQTGEKRDGKRARHVASPSARLLFLSSCCLRAGSSTAAPCQLLLPQKPPCMQSRSSLPSLLGHAFPPLPPLLYSNQFQAIKRSVLGNTYKTHKHSKWDNFIGKNISRAETDKECIVLFVLQTWLIVHYEMHQLPCTGRINEHIHLWTHSFKMNTFIYSLGKLLTSNFTLSCQTSPMTRELNLSFLRTLLLFIETGHS